MKKTIGRDLPNGGYIEITAHDERHFSISGQGYEKHGTWDGRARKRNCRDIDFGGQCIDEMRTAAPELEPLYVAHLADAKTGTPMHAVANGWYFYSNQHEAYELKAYGQGHIDRYGTPHERAARCLHITPSELPADLDEDRFRAFCEGLKPVWARQAEAARATLEAMIDGDGVEDI